MNRQDVPRLELGSRPEDACWSGDVEKAQVRSEGVPIEGAVEGWMGKERLELRGEGDYSGCTENVERLDAETVSD